MISNMVAYGADCNCTIQFTLYKWLFPTWSNNDVEIVQNILLSITDASNS